MRTYPIGLGLLTLRGALKVYEEQPTFVRLCELKQVWWKCYRTLLDKKQEKLVDILHLQIRKSLVTEVNNARHLILNRSCENRGNFD